MFGLSSRLSPITDVATKQWEHLGSFRRGSVDSPVLESKDLVKKIDELKEENVVLARESSQLQRANDRQFDQIFSMRAQIVELNERIASLQAKLGEKS